MPKEGIFAEVISEGEVKVGDEIIIDTMSNVSMTDFSHSTTNARISDPKGIETGHPSPLRGDGFGRRDGRGMWGH